MSLAHISSTLATICFSTLALIACSDSGATPQRSSGSGSATAADTSSSIVAEAMPPSCDQYLEKMKACIAKAPEADRASRTEALEKTRATWAEEARDPKTSPNLLAACNAALAAVTADAACQ